MNRQKAEYFLTLEKLGTISATAQKFYISPSAVSQQLGHEEDEEGVTLFECQKHRMVPTKAGEQYMKCLREIMEIDDETKAALSRHKAAEKSFRILITPMLRRIAETQLLPAIGEKLPHQSFTVTYEGARTAEAYLQYGYADIALYCSAGKSRVGLLEDVLGEGQLKLVVPQAYLRGKIDGIPSISDLTNIPFILLKKGNPSRRAEDAVLRKNHLPQDRIYEVSDRQMVLSFLMDGRGAGFLPSYMIPASDRHRFFILDPDPAMEYQYILARPQESEAQDAAEQTAAVIREVFQKALFSSGCASE